MGSFKIGFNPLIDGVEIVGVEIVLVGEKDVETDLGAVTISRDGREYILDVIQSYTYPNFEEGVTFIDTDLILDDETFDECPYDITAEDLFSDDLKVELYISTDNEIQSMVLVIKLGDEIKTINVTEE
jgi:hypothetical protein